MSRENETTTVKKITNTDSMCEDSQTSIMTWMVNRAEFRTLIAYSKIYIL